MRAGFKVMDPEKKQQTSQQKSPNSLGLKKVRQAMSKLKSKLIIFFDIMRIVHKAFVLEGKTVNSAYYCDVSRQLGENEQRLWPKFCQQNSWLLHHN
jgi:hypothetical protein